MTIVSALLCAAAIALSGSVRGAPVYSFYVLDYDFVNNTGTTATDFHFRLTFASANGIGFTNPGPANFVIPGTTGPFSNVVGSFDSTGRDFTIDMSGATVQPGAGAAMHIAIPVVGSPAFEVTSAYWTMGGSLTDPGTRIVPPRANMDPDPLAIRRAFRLVPEPSALALSLLACLALWTSRIAWSHPGWGHAAARARPR